MKAFSVYDISFLWKPSLSMKCPINENLLCQWNPISINILFCPWNLWKSSLTMNVLFSKIFSVYKSIKIFSVYEICTYPWKSSLPINVLKIFTCLWNHLSMKIFSVYEKCSLSMKNILCLCPTNCLFSMKWKVIITCLENLDLKIY